MLAIAAAIVSLLAQGSPKLTDRVFSTLTGENGYEEYVKAADIVDTPQFHLYLDPSPDVLDQAVRDDPKVSGLAQKLKSMSLLAVRQEAVQRFGPALELVRKGNLKNVYDPRSDITPETIFPELRNFKYLARLFTFESYVRFAEGNPSAGTKALLDGLVFSYNISGGCAISSLVGVATSAIVLASVEERLPMFSVSDCSRARSLAQEALKAPRQLRKALEVERKLTTSILDEVFAKPDLLYKIAGDGDQRTTDRLKTVVAALRTHGPQEAAKWKRDVADAINQHYLTVAELLKRPEYQWFGAESDPDSSVPLGSDPVVKSLLESVMPFTPQILQAEAKLRTQFRLLSLHAAVLEFKWKSGHLPKNLGEAVTSAESQDPLANAPFHFEPHGSSYRLYSQGNTATGPIELKYRRVSDSAADGGPINP